MHQNKLTRPLCINCSRDMILYAPPIKIEAHNLCQWFSGKATQLGWAGQSD